MGIDLAKDTMLQVEPVDRDQGAITQFDPSWFERHSEIR
jgi:hypothetical protein